MKGFTLAEVVIAMVLTAIIAASVFAIALTARSSSLRSSCRADGTYAAKELTEKLRNYVAASKEFIGPGAGEKGWQLPEDTCAAGACSCPEGSYALRPDCVHDASALLRPELAGEQCKMTLTYEVFDEAASAGSCGDPERYPCETFLPRVDVRLAWGAGQ